MHRPQRNTPLTIDEAIEEFHSILEGWFGERLEDSEREEDHRKYLYEPIENVIRRVKPCD